MTFEVFFESMFELAELWATDFTDSSLAAFLLQLYDRVTVAKSGAESPSAAPFHSSPRMMSPRFQAAVVGLTDHKLRSILDRKMGPDSPHAGRVMYKLHDAEELTANLVEVMTSFVSSALPAPLMQSVFVPGGGGGMH